MSEDITPQFLMISKSVIEELFERLDADLSEKDAVAVATALSKGMTRAAKVTAASFPNARLHDPTPEEVDIWAEKYGGA